MSERREKWAAFDAKIESFKARNLAPAFVQEGVKGGLWQIQQLYRPPIPSVSSIHRIFLDPPNPQAYEPRYQPWPGGRRGWMCFETKEAARDFYKFDNDNMTLEDFCATDPRPWSGRIINLDENGELVE